MAAISTIVMVAAAGIGAATAISGMRQQKKAAREQRRAQEAANKARAGQAAIENRARRAKLIRQAQMARATAENIQATQGGGAGITTSMATGALATADTQQAVNLANFAEQGRQGGLLADANLMLGRARSRMQRGQAMTKLGGTLLSNAQRIGGMFNTFGNIGAAQSSATFGEMGAYTTSGPNMVSP